MFVVMLVGRPAYVNASAFALVVVIRPPLIGVGVAAVLLRLSRRQSALVPSNLLAVLPAFRLLVVDPVFVTFAGLPIALIVVVMLTIERHNRGRHETH